MPSHQDAVLLSHTLHVPMQVTLKLIETFVDKCEDLSLVTESLVPAMMDPILGDYARNVPDARYCACPPLTLPH